MNDFADQECPTIWQDTGETGEALLVYSQGVDGSTPVVAPIRFGVAPEIRAAFDYRPRFPVAGQEIVFDAARVKASVEFLLARLTRPFRSSGNSAGCP